MDHWDVIPESIRVDVEVVERQHRPTYRLPNGKDSKGGASLRSMVEKLGGWSGLLHGPWGDQHVSLEDLRDEDLDDTFVQISIRGLPVEPKKTDPAIVEQMARAPVDHLSLHAVAEDDPHWGVMSRSCWSLRELQEHLGGEEGNLPDRHGELHHVSLRAWRHADPDRTRIVVKSMLRSEPSEGSAGSSPGG